MKIQSIKDPWPNGFNRLIIHAEILGLFVKISILFSNKLKLIRFGISDKVEVVRLFKLLGPRFVVFCFSLFIPM